MQHMSIIDILVPVLARPQNIEPLVSSIESATEVPHRTLFIASKGDREEIKALERSGAEYLVHPTKAGHGNFAKKINWAFPKTSAPWVFQGADDLLFHPGWDVAALKVGKERGVGVVGTDDMGNPLVKRGAHSTHTLIRRDYIETYGGTFDNTGLVFCELYDHEFTDNEFIQTAIRRKQWAFSRESKVEHLHPAWGKSKIDSTYTKAFRGSKPDLILYKERMRVLSPGRGDRRARYALKNQARIDARIKMREDRNKTLAVPGGPSVSIIIATHGDSSWERLAQSRPLPSANLEPAEVLIGHDPDGNRATVRNALAAKATGDYLCFLDADDELNPGYVYAMQKMHVRHYAGTELLLTPKVSYVINGRKKTPKFWAEVPFEQANWIVVSTLVSRKLFHEVGGWYEDFDPKNWNEYDDYEFWIRCYKAGARVLRVPRAILIAHQEPTSRHRIQPHAVRARWHYEIGQMHYPDLYTEDWLARHG